MIHYLRRLNEFPPKTDKNSTVKSQVEEKCPLPGYLTKVFVKMGSY
ncbi:MAG: hypothetical protein MJ077_02210 [Oscillospiraceae bacterium]|nr:hypothetical protein [Oscillospiraceae bacterium]